MTAGRVIAVGIAVLDEIFRVAHLPTAPGKHFSSELLVSGGGPAATASVTIARLGGGVEFWARLGDDDAATFLLDELRQEGVDVEHVRRIAGARTSRSAVTVDPEGERLIVAFADPRLDADPAWLPIDRIARADAVLADMRWPEAAVAALAEARRRSVPAVLDADSIPEGASTAPLEAASYLLFSQPGLRQATGEGEIVSGLAAAARRWPASWLGVTAGMDGAFWRMADGTIGHQPAFSVDAVDTTGAGDVFHGAFALALARGSLPQDALRFAAAAAAIKCTRPGGRAGIPHTSDLDRFLSGAAA